MAENNAPASGGPSRINKYISKRSVIIIAICMIAWCAILIRLFYLQIISYEAYQNEVIDNIERETTVTPTRGIIYDSNMIQLATNKTTWRIFISPRDIENEKQGKLIASNLADILGADYNDIIQKEAKKERADETVAKDISEEEFDKVVDFIEENELHRQVHYQSYTVRDYPYGSLASHVIGFCGTDGGLIGLEYKYDGVLTGVAGKYITARDARGKKMPYKYDTYIEAENGVNLVTTINMKIQSVLEAQLKNTYFDSEAIHRVTGIVMNPNTGAVYGMGTYPDFNLNSPYELDDYSKNELEEYAEENKLKEDSEEYQKKYWEEVNGMWKNKAVS
ncbi:MAG: hypothetical protein IJT91_07815, partial [Clostridia bacterium]|nr:hypothetical protein [Clostridia bacterium]